jgi:8-oxo-dGTP pyrophosphatase MutT (NUDIX family)
VSLYAEAVRTLTAWVAPDEDQELLRKEYVDYLQTHPDGMTRESRPAHLTASTVILDEAAARTLLVLHTKIGLWVQPGGHCEAGDPTLREAALREGREETGVEGLVASQEPLVLSKHCAPCGAESHYDVQYLVTAPADAMLVVSEESHDVRWFPVDELPSDVALGVADSVRAATERAARRSGR